MREELFRRLSEYKQVVSPGSFLNNTGEDAKRCSWSEKYRYLRESKFTIAGDSISYSGFVTEKIVQPFIQHSIPVYFGNPEIDKDFNTKAFVWCHDEKDLDRCVEEVEYLDNHDEAYVEMLMQFPLHNEQYLSMMYSELEKFLVNIFSQDKESAYRRVKHFCANNHENYLREYARRYEKTPELVRKLKEIIKGKRK